MAEVLHHDGSFLVSPSRTVVSISALASFAVGLDDEPHPDEMNSRAPAERIAAIADEDDRSPAISERMA